MRQTALVSLALAAACLVAACVHATGHLPSGPPPEYEETPLPTNASTRLPDKSADGRSIVSLPTSGGDAGPLPTHPASEPPALH